VVAVPKRRRDARPEIERLLLEMIAELNQAGVQPDASQVPRLARVDERAGEAALWALHYAGYIDGIGVSTRSTRPGAALLSVKLTKKGEQAIDNRTLG
jgi:hypothetical protein